jgi:hypothetical protein
MSGLELEHVMRTSGDLAVIESELAARLLNVSGSGCLLEVGSPVVLGATGHVTVALEGRRCTDAVRVIRCQPVSGGSSYLVGLEFLWLDCPREESVRRLVMEAAVNGAAPPAVMELPPSSD